MRLATSSRPATVVGAGVSGLSSALRLAQAGWQVRVLARDFSPHTTSDVAAAVWYPFHVGEWRRVLAWARVTYDVLKGLAASEPDSGVTMCAGVELFGEAMPEPWLAELVADARRARADEVPAPFVDGYAFTVPVVAMNSYMPWLQRRAEAAGVGFEVRRVRSLASLTQDAAVVVNCAGLGARELVADVDLHPVRGQIVRVAPGYAHRFVQATAGPGPITYIIPRGDSTILGGTLEPDAWDLKPDPAVESAIRARSAQIEPALAAAPVIASAVGLRPARSSIRLEAERCGAATIIHNYGHGGAGITVSWGCAAEVVDLAAGDAPPAIEVAATEEGSVDL
jgi:D-amino-acid oxidase